MVGYIGMRERVTCEHAQLTDRRTVSYHGSVDFPPWVLNIKQISVNYHKQVVIERSNFVT